MKKLLPALAVGALCFAAVPACAKMFPLLLFPHSPQIGRFFESGPAFSASVQWQARKGTNTLEVRYETAFVPGKSRAEVDWLKSSIGQPPEEIAQMKKAAMDRHITVWRLDQKKKLTMFPGRRQYIEEALTDELVEHAYTALTNQETDLGEEKVEGHSCRKLRAVMADKFDGKYEVTLWRAKDLKKFPVKLEEADTDKTITMRFENVKLSKPADSLFEVPPGYERIEKWPDLSQPFPPEKPAPHSPMNPPPPPPQ